MDAGAALTTGQQDKGCDTKGYGNADNTVSCFHYYSQLVVNYYVDLYGIWQLTRLLCWYG
jgi:hypothetical protein